MFINHEQAGNRAKTKKLENSKIIGDLQSRDWNHRNRFLQKKYLDKSCWFCVSSYRLWLLFTKEFLQICVLFQWVIATEVGDLKPNNFSWLSLTCLCAFRCTRKSAFLPAGMQENFNRTQAGQCSYNVKRDCRQCGRELRAIISLEWSLVAFENWSQNLEATSSQSSPFLNRLA